MSEIRANTISDAAGTGAATLTGQYTAKAWVNFNGTGTAAIRVSANVSSITDNGTGNFNVNFTTAFTDADYVTFLNGSGDTGDNFMDGTPTTSSVNTRWVDIGAGARDPVRAQVSVIR